MQQKIVRYLVDNDLSPDIATGLRPWFDITHFLDIPELVNDPIKGDKPCIEWCQQNGVVWITADKAARKRYRADLLASRISVLWIHGPSKFPSWLQFKIVVRVIDGTTRLQESAHGGLHMRAGVKGGPTPKVIWAEYARDRPRMVHSGP